MIYKFFEVRKWEIIIEKNVDDHLNKDKLPSYAICKLSLMIKFLIKILLTKNMLWYLNSDFTEQCK